MGLSWQQGPFAPGAIGRFLVPDPLPGRLLFAEPLRCAQIWRSITGPSTGWPRSPASSAHEVTSDTWAAPPP